MEQNYVLVPASSPRMLRVSTPRAEFASKVMQRILIGLALAASAICFSMVGDASASTVVNAR